MDQKKLQQILSLKHTGYSIKVLKKLYFNGELGKWVVTKSGEYGGPLREDTIWQLSKIDPIPNYDWKEAYKQTWGTYAGLARMTTLPYNNTTYYEFIIAEKNLMTLIKRNSIELLGYLYE